MNTVISIDIKSNFGFFKKPDVNDCVYFSYNCIHRPALLGIFGTILGLEGYSQNALSGSIDCPNYYKKLNHLRLAIEPLYPKNKGVFQKLIITYSNTVGYANTDGTLIVKEQILIKPEYRIYISLDLEKEIDKNLFNSLRNGESTYIPYMGKNEFHLFWDNFTEYVPQFNYRPNKAYRIDSIFTGLKKDYFEKVNSFEDIYIYTEKLPIGFDKEILNYKLEEFIFSNILLSSNCVLDNLCLLNPDKKLIQFINTKV